VDISFVRCIFVEVVFVLLSFHFQLSLPASAGAGLWLLPFRGCGEHPLP
jgi:hypothetical protein